MRKFSSKTVIPAKAGIQRFFSVHNHGWIPAFAGMTILIGSLSTTAMADETAITIYSKAQPGAVDPNMYRPVVGQQNYGQPVPGYAVVRVVRKVDLPFKDNLLKFGDVAALLDPTTVQFKSLTDPKGTKVVEQNYQFDLISQRKLMEKYINKEIEVEQVQGDKISTIKGTLMSVQDGITLKTDKGVVTIAGYPQINFPELPGGLITKPTLVWEIMTGKTGEHKAEVSYQTDGITWWADYNLTFTEGKDANSGTVDLGSWVSILNQSGATYRDAKLKLMAGDINRIQPPQAYGGMMAKRDMAMAESVPAPPAFAEKAFFEYHLYTLSKPATIPENSTKQLELIPAATNVPVEKMLVYKAADYSWGGGVIMDQYYGGEANKKIEVVLKLSNKEANGLGKPLPAGRVRVNQRDEDGSLEFIGENVIDHTARNEDILIKLGNAFDVVGERKQTNFFVDTKAKVIEEEFEIKIRNQKKVSAKIRVIEPLYRATNWEIASKSDDYTKDDAHTIHFDVNVGAEKEKVIKYRVKYTW